MLKNRNIMINVLIGISILMFASLIFCTPKICSMILSFWVMTVLWNIRLMLIPKLSIYDLINGIHIKAQEYQNKNQYGLMTIYYMIVPMMVLGMIMVVLLLSCMFNM